MKRVLSLALLLVTSLRGQGVFEKRVVPIAGDESRRFQKQVKVALVVGVSKYPAGSGFTPLNYAAADANDLAAVLKQQGYLVRVLADSDATRGAITQTLHDLGDMAEGEQSTFLFFFSGHGFALRDKNYLAPFSASVSELEREGLAVEEVEQLIAHSRARRELMLLDACRSDESSGTKGADARSFAAFQAAEGLRILNSTRLGKLSYESQELRHGVFTAFLLKGLLGDAAGSDGLVTFHDLTDYVTDSVRRWSSDHNKVQVPYEAVGRKEASGDFLLARAAAKGASSPAPASAAVDAGGAVSPNSSNSDLERYQAARLLHDPDQIEAEAGKISNPAIANLLRMLASSMRTGGVTAGRPESNPRMRLQAASTRTQADLFANQGNYVKAFPLYQQLAASGDSNSMVKLGDMYYSGLGTPQNYAEAAHWFQKAAEEGETTAMPTLGFMYLSGRGVPQNDALALQWDRKAADMGNAEAMLALGFIYQNGRGVPKDITQAAAWYRKAADLGNATAKQNLQRMNLK